MLAMWLAPLIRSHANPLVTEMEVTSDTAASRPVRRKEARIIVSIYRLNPRKNAVGGGLRPGGLIRLSISNQHLGLKAAGHKPAHCDVVVGTCFDDL